MTLGRYIGLGTTVLILGSAGCRPARESSTATESASRVAMDSAEIERLCAEPDSVRAGRADCLLKDQSPPRVRRPQPSTPPR